MNGIHDMGGMHGFGQVEREENEPVLYGKLQPPDVLLRYSFTASIL